MKESNEAVGNDETRSSYQLIPSKKLINGDQVGVKRSGKIFLAKIVMQFPNSFE